MFTGENTFDMTIIGSEGHTIIIHVDLSGETGTCEIELPDGSLTEGLSDCEWDDEDYQESYMALMYAIEYPIYQIMDSLGLSM